MISQGWKNQRRPEEAAPLKVKRLNAPQARGGHWLDSMLGQGSRSTVDSAVGRFRRPDSGAGAPSPRREAPKATLRMQAVGSGDDAAKPGGRAKGSLRLALAGLALLGAAAKFKPWHALESIKMPDLARVEKPAEPQAEPAKSPLLDAQGTPVALWRSASGQWYGVNAKAQLCRMAEADAEARLNLPRLEGPALGSQEVRGGHLMTLQVDSAQLAELLPIRADLCGMLDAVLVQGRDFRLRSHLGALADLGEGDFQRKQARLAAVLADLGARKKRALNVDLRFENSAVVRLASR